MLIDCKGKAADIKKKLKFAIDTSSTTYLIQAIVDNNGASNSYLRGLKKNCEELGVLLEEVNVENVFMKDTYYPLSNLKNDFRSYPKNFKAYAINMSSTPINIFKYVDLDSPRYIYTDINKGISNIFIPGTVRACLHAVEDFNLDGKNVLVIGRSERVGKPLSYILSSKLYNATVTMAHTHTKNLKDLVNLSDMIFVAAGHPNTVTEDMLHDGQIVIDVGINCVEDSTKKSGYKIIGDVGEITNPKIIYTPVPGGIGALTSISLLENMFVN